MTIHHVVIILFFINWMMMRHLVRLKYQCKGGDVMARLKNMDWKLYLALLFIFAPLVLLSVFFLPGDYKILSFIWVLVFWVMYHGIRIKSEKAEAGQKKHK